MKTKFLLVILLSFLPSISFFSQSGRDFIICIDNSGSISDPDFQVITDNSRKLIEGILTCNPNNRVSVVHYGTGLYNMPNTTYQPRIYIESDFTNNLSTALNFTRRLSIGDHFHEALGFIGNALDNVSNTNIVSPQITLNHNTAVPLVVILYTDADRSSGSLSGGSYLVNFYNTNFNSPSAFTNVSSFKSDRNAEFIVMHKSPSPDATAAAAAISSPGGNYSGIIENYNGDPDFGALPKWYFPQSDFVLESSTYDSIINHYCIFNGSLKFLYEKGEACTSNSNPQYGTIFGGEFLLPVGATLDSMKMFAVDISTNNEIPVNFNPIIIGNTFTYSIQSNDISPIPSFGEYKLRIDLTFNYAGAIQKISSWNNYPSTWFGGSDINFGACKNGLPPKTVYNIPSFPAKVDKNANPNNLNNQLSIEKISTFKLFPNPNNGVFSILMDKVKSGKLDITDINGKNIYSEFFENKNTLSVNLKNKNNGIYFIKITDMTGEISIKKIIINK